MSFQQWPRELDGDMVDDDYYVAGEPGYRSQSALLLRSVARNCRPIWTPETGWCES